MVIDGPLPRDTISYTDIIGTEKNQKTEDLQNKVIAFLKEKIPDSSQ